MLFDNDERPYYSYQRQPCVNIDTDTHKNILFYPEDQLYQCSIKMGHLGYIKHDGTCN